MRIPEDEISLHNWQTLEDCRYCSIGQYIRVKHMKFDIHVGKDGIYAETEDLVL